MVEDDFDLEGAEPIPPATNKRTVISVSLNAEERDVVLARAEVRGMSMSVYLKHAATANEVHFEVNGPPTGTGTSVTWYLGDSDG